MTIGLWKCQPIEIIHFSIEAKPCDLGVGEWGQLKFILNPIFFANATHIDQLYILEWDSTGKENIFVVTFPIFVYVL